MSPLPPTDFLNTRTAECECNVNRTIYGSTTRHPHSHLHFTLTHILNRYACIVVRSVCEQMETREYVKVHAEYMHYSNIFVVRVLHFGAFICVGKSPNLPFLKII